MIYNLPKGYLSYSAWSLWKQSKESYRKRYYLNEKAPETPQTRFGKEQHAIKEADESVVGSETQLKAEISEGLMIMGFLDSLDPDTLKIIDFKFSHLSKTGKEPWDAVKVRKHEQFPFYCLMVKVNFGRFNPECELHWHETKFKENKVAVYQGRKYELADKSMEVTGRVEKFVRIVEDWEVERMREEIIKTALEISEDYTIWTKNNLGK